MYVQKPRTAIIRECIDDQAEIPCTVIEIHSLRPEGGKKYFGFNETWHLEVFFLDVDYEFGVEMKKLKMVHLNS